MYFNILQKYKYSHQNNYKINTKTRHSIAGNTPKFSVTKRMYTED